MKVVSPHRKMLFDVGVSVCVYTRDIIRIRDANYRLMSVFKVRI